MDISKNFNGKLRFTLTLSTILFSEIEKIYITILNSNSVDYYSLDIASGNPVYETDNEITDVDSSIGIFEINYDATRSIIHANTTSKISVSVVTTNDESDEIILDEQLNIIEKITQL